MAAHDVYRKTALGHAEIANRKLKLHPRIRTMLIMVDGARTEGEMRAEAQQVGAPAEFVEQLAALGLIEKVGAAAAAPEPPLARTRPGVPKDEFERFRAAKSFMNNAAVDALGLRSFMFTMRLEKAGTLEELRALAHSWNEEVAKADPKQTKALQARLQELLR